MKSEIYFILLLVVTIVSCEENDSGSASIYQDNLSSDRKTWVTDSTRLHVRKFYHEHYSIREDSANRFEYSLAPHVAPQFPFSVQVDGIIQVDDPNQIGYIGIIFNYIDSNYYTVFQISNNGVFSIWSNNKGNYTTITPNTLCSSFQKGNGAKNTLKLNLNSTGIELQINNDVIGSFQASMVSGNIQIGILAGNVNGTHFSPTTGLFNNFISRKN